MLLITIKSLKKKFNIQGINPTRPVIIISGLCFNTCRIKNGILNNEKKSIKYFEIFPVFGIILLIFKKSIK